MSDKLSILVQLDTDPHPSVFDRVVAVAAATQPGAWEIGATAFGEMLPNHANRITLDTAKTDKWGLPVVKIDCATGENERLMRKDMANDMAETLEACGVLRGAAWYDLEFALDTAAPAAHSSTPFTCMTTVPPTKHFDMRCRFL